MAIDFPNSPNVNDTYTVDDKTFIWTGDYWRVLNSPNYISTLIKDADNDTKVEVEQSADEDTVRITTGGAERYSIGTDGHIIPTANEAYDLGSASNRFRDLYLSGSSIDLGGVSITSDGTNLALPPISSVSGDFTVDTDTLHVDSTNNRVGIGTITPTDTLDVSGNIIVSGTVDGRDVASDGTKLDGIESGATADQTASEILTAIKTVDGTGSGLDADTLDGAQGSDYALKTYVDTAVSNLVDAAPATLDTLNELAAALGDDANFATTVTNSIATKQDSATALTTSTSFGGDVSGTYNAIVVANDSHTHDASNLTGNTLASGVTASSLTSVGNLSSLTVSGDVTVDTNTLFVDSTNNRVGIGTTSPETLLHVSSGTSGDAELRISADTDNDNEGDLPYLSLCADGGIIEGVIGLNNNSLVISNSNTSQGGIDFRVGSTNVYTTTADQIAASTTRMFIDSSGNVGIGTTSPDNRLHVKDGSIEIENGDLRFFPDTSGNGFEMDYSAGKMYFGSNTEYATSWKMTILDNGNVGIGTTTPSRLLDVEDGANTTSQVLAEFMQPNLATNNSSQIYLGKAAGSNTSSTLTYTYNSATPANSHLSLGLYGNSYSLSITGAGNVGIGTTTPSTALDVAGVASVDGLNVAGENVTPYTGRKNYIYNGSFQVAQRGTSVSTASGYTLDRWRIEPVNQTYTAGISGTIQQVDDGGYAMSIRSGGTAPGFYMIEQRFEGQDVAHLAGKTVTFSFKVKRVSTTVSSGTIKVNHDDDLSGSLRDEATIATVESNVSSISTSAYEQYSTSYTFPATVSTTGYYRIGIYFHGMGGVATSSEMFRIKDVQLEEGGVATPFEHRSFGEELALCKRYFFRCIDPAGVGVTDSASRATRVLIPFNTEMRAAPTSSVSGTFNFWNGGSAGTATGLLLIVNNRFQGQLDFNGGVGSAGGAVTLYTNGGSQYIDFAAEL